jgi:23S rRNA pseudouridine2605 synthase
MEERLQKLIAHSGLTSRRGAEELIRQGRVRVAGRPAHLGQKVDPEKARVEVDGVSLPIRPGAVYLLVNKPPGLLSTAHDPYGRPTVVDLVPAETRLYPVGRLDADSEGLMLLTNDGDLADLVTHPRYGVSKTYTVLAEGVPSRAALRSLAEGVQLEDGPARARSARLLDARDRKALVEVVMGEGRKREVRRMFEVIGHPVLRLVRTAIGPLRDSTLSPGEWRPLTLEEIRALYQAAGDR